MMGFDHAHSNGFRCSGAAAASSAHLRPKADTVSILAVSVCVLPLVCLAEASW